MPMVRAFTLGLCLLAAACSPAGSATVPDGASQPKKQRIGAIRGGTVKPDKPPSPKVSNTISYGTDPLQVVDLWMPTSGRPPYPVVLLIHGGCWKTRIAERDIMDPIAADLAKNGIAVWNIEYRGIDKGGGYPGTFDDVAAAADLLVRDGRDRYFDVRRAAVLGHSAGGHLAFWLANRPALPAGSRFRAETMFVPHTAIALAGIPDLRELSTGGHCGTDGARALSDRGGDFVQTSPPEMAPSAVHQVQYNGGRDGIAPPDFARAYETKMAAKGVAVKSFVIPDADHFDLIRPGGPGWNSIRATIALALFARVAPGREARYDSGTAPAARFK